MLHAKYQDYKTIRFCRRRFSKVFTEYGHGGHHGHVTWSIHINFLSPFKRRLHMKFGVDWPSAIKKILKNGGHIHAYSPGAGADNPLGSNSFH